MIPELDSDGNLPSGVHWAAWEEVINRFGTNSYRRSILEGLKGALDSLKAAGCQTAYIDGSFVTQKELPGDFDGCWDINGVDPALLDPVLLKFENKRAAQKIKYKGEFFPADWDATGTGVTYLEFFQIDKQTGNPKGIIALDLKGF